MLTKETETYLVDKEVYYYKDNGPYETARAAMEDAVSAHTTLSYGGTVVLSKDKFLDDKELLIALGDWAKNS